MHVAFGATCTFTQIAKKYDIISVTAVSVPLRTGMGLARHGQVYQARSSSGLFRRNEKWKPY